MRYALVEAIKDTLAEAEGVARAQAHETLTDGMTDWPTVQVTWERTEADFTSRTDRSTFGAGLRQKQVTVHVDVYVRQRALIGEDMAAVAAVADAIEDVLDAQRAKPFFGLAAIRAFKWTSERVTFAYGDPELRFAGARFVLTCSV